MELSFAKLINRLTREPRLVAQAGGDVEQILANGGVNPTQENKAALRAFLHLPGKLPSHSIVADEVIGWDGGEMIVPLAVTR